MTASQLRPKGPKRDWGSNDTGAHILHMDMDAFFASVEIRDDPSLAGKPVIVGRPGGRSVVSSASYEARVLGVHSAMPGAVAARLAPQAIFVDHRFEAYQQASRQVMQILRRFSDLVEPLSIDEAFVDVSRARRAVGTPTQIARQIRQDVRDEVGLPCSVGIAGVTMVAKIASALAKPDGTLLIPVAYTRAFLAELPVGRLWGVGERTEVRLNGLGITTVAELLDLGEARLARILGEASAARLIALAMGEELRPVSTGHEEKSMGSERTFARDLDADDPQVHHVLATEAQTVARRLRHKGLVGSTVSIKVRFEDFTTVSRSRSLAKPTDVAAEIEQVASSLFRDLSTDGRQIRLVGVAIEKLAAIEEVGRQLTLTDTDDRTRRTEQVADEVATRFGHSALVPARTLAIDPPDRP